jgi:micrococcal nuclease
MKSGCFSSARVAFASILAGIIGTTGQALAASSLPCGLRDAGEATVVERVGTDTLLLEDGRAVRLIGALPPRVAPDWSDRLNTDERLSNALDTLAIGKRVRLGIGGRERDRYGRLLAHVFIEQDGGLLWVQESLIGAGLALGYSFADNDACINRLQAAEETARRAANGFWADGLLRVRDAADEASMAKLTNSFQVVAGKPHEVTEVRGRIYINFSDNWRTDFTISISPTARKAFPDQGAGLLQLAGREIRVRGWLKQRNGPVIHVTHPAQIEVIARTNSVAAGEREATTRAQ